MPVPAGGVQVPAAASGAGRLAAFVGTGVVLLQAAMVAAKPSTATVFKTMCRTI